MPLLLSSCFTPTYTEKPDYLNTRYTSSNLKAGIKVTEVTDNRGAPDAKYSWDKDDYKFLGYIDNGGVDWKYQFEHSVNTFVKKSFDVIFADNDSKVKKQIKVQVDTFLVSEKFYLFSEKIRFRCSMDFIFNENGTEKIIKTRFDDTLTSPFEARTKVQFLIYDGVYDCARQFMKSIEDSLVPRNNVNKPKKLFADKESEYDDIFGYKEFSMFEFNLNSQNGLNQNMGIEMNFSYHKGQQNSIIVHRAIGGYSLNFIDSTIILHQFTFGYSPLIYFTKKQENFLLNPSAEFGFNPYMPTIRIKQMAAIKVWHFMFKAGFFQLILPTHFNKSDYGFSAGFSYLFY